MADTKAGYFAGKTATIFGGGRNIGREIAREIARRGARVAIGDIDEEGAREAAALVIDEGGEAIGVRANVMDSGSLREAAAAAEAALGEIDIVINNAGLLHAGNPEDFPLAEWQRMMDCNFFGIVRSNEIFLPKMIARGSGHLVNTASFAGLYPYASSRAPYAASKAAIVSLSQNLALYLDPKGIRVTCLCPGPTASAVSLANNSFSQDVVNRGPGSELGVKTMGEVAAILADAMATGRILVPTHDEGYTTIRDWAASPDDFIRGKVAAFEAGDSGLPARRPVAAA